MQGLAAPPRLEEPGDLGGHGATDPLACIRHVDGPAAPVEGPQTERRLAPPAKGQHGGLAPGGLRLLEGTAS